MSKSFWNPTRNNDQPNYSKSELKKEDEAAAELSSPLFLAVQTQHMPAQVQFRESSFAGLASPSFQRAQFPPSFRPTFSVSTGKQQLNIQPTQDALLDDVRVKKPPVSDDAESFEASHPVGWNLHCLALQTLPYYYQLEKCHIEFPKKQLCRVLGKLQDFFRSCSLKVEYKNGIASTVNTFNAKETVKAICLAMDSVEFVVPFWIKDDATVIAEVQRTGGDSMLFCQHQYAKRVMMTIHQGCATESLKPRAPAVPYDPLNLCMDAAKDEQRVIDGLLRVQNSSGSFFFHDKTGSNEMKSAFSILESMIASKRCDRVTMAFDSIIAMTDPRKSGLKCSKETAENVLQDDMTTVSDSVLYLALTGDWPPYVKTDDDRTMSLDSTSSSCQQHSFQALTILAQSVNVLDDSQIRVFSRLAREKGLAVVLPLVVAVEQAQDSPHKAYLAAHILTALCRVMPDVRNQIAEDHLSAVQNAHQVGCFGHAGLALAGQRLLDTLST